MKQAPALESFTRTAARLAAQAPESSSGWIVGADSVTVTPATAEDLATQPESIHRTREELAATIAWGLHVLALEAAAAGRLYDAGDVARVAVERGAMAFFSGRVRELADVAATAAGRLYGDREVLPFVTVRVARRWPAAGSIVLERLDGRRFGLVLDGPAFKVERL